MVTVAQLAERLTVDQKVTGSYPVFYPNKYLSVRAALKVESESPISYCYGKTRAQQRELYERNLK